MTTTIAHAAVGNNALLSVSGYGMVTTRVETISYGVQAFSKESEAVNYKAFYPGWIQDVGFSLVLVFKDASERDAMNNWVHTYMTRVTTGAISRGSMLVAVPTRNFYRRAVPMGTLLYGDSRDQSGKAYRTNLVFAGATDPMNVNAASSFQAQKNDAKNSPYYPGSAQAAGAESLAGTIFDEAHGATSLAQATAIVDPPPKPAPAPKPSPADPKYTPYNPGIYNAPPAPTSTSLFGVPGL
jgi:hypothetical protein